MRTPKIGVSPVLTASEARSTVPSPPTQTSSAAPAARAATSDWPAPSAPSGPTHGSQPASRTCSAIESAMPRAPAMPGW